MHKEKIVEGENWNILRNEEVIEMEVVRMSLFFEELNNIKCCAGAYIHGVTKIKVLFVLNQSWKAWTIHFDYLHTISIL